MTGDLIPADLVPSGCTPVFSEETAPAALQQEHRLADGTWGVLHVLEGRISFVDLRSLEESAISAPGQVTIHPGAPHRVAIDGLVEFRIDFFRESHPET